MCSSEAGVIRKMGLFYHGMICSTPGLLTCDGIHLYLREERALAQEILELIDRALNELGKGKYQA